MEVVAITLSAALVLIVFLVTRAYIKVRALPFQDPLEVLDVRFARGEITELDYRAKRMALIGAEPALELGGQ